MDEQTRGAIGCGWAILGVAFLVAASFTGGTFRTEVTYQPPKFGAVSGEGSSVPTARPSQTAPTMANAPIAITGVAPKGKYESTWRRWPAAPASMTA